MSRRGSRTRRQPSSHAAKALPVTGPAYTAEQVQALLQLQRGNTTAVPLPRPPRWATDPFGPGFPLPPAPINIPRRDTGRAEPRLWEYPPAYNVQVTTRTFVPWATLRQASAMPLFRKLIEARKAVCSLGYAVTVDPKAVTRESALTGQPKKDVEAGMRRRFTAEIARVSDWLEMPDRGNGHDWETWARLLFENRLVYDATVVYPKRTYGGETYSFEVPDGSLFKPLLDERGGRPQPPHPAVQQILYGYPRGEFTADVDPDDVDPLTGKPRVPGGYGADEILYERTVIRPNNPYGMPATEIALLDGLVWMRRMGWILAEYTEGVQPAAFLKNTGETDWTVEQWEDYAIALNQLLAGNTRERMRWPMLPPGVEPVQSAEISERYKPDYDRFLVTLICGDFGLPPSEIGFTTTGALGSSFHEGEEDILNRRTRIPDANWLSRLATRLCRRQLDMPRELVVQILGLESEDEAAQDAVAQVRVSGGRMTLNEDRARQGLPPYTFAEADMPMLMTQRGVVFLQGASTQAPPGELIMPAHTDLQADGQLAPPKGAGTQPKALPPGKADAKDGQDAAKSAALAKHASEKTKADEVYHQLTEDYPRHTLDWVHHAAWSGPALVPLEEIDTSGRDRWRASHEQAKVDLFAHKIAKKLKKGKRPKPVILVRTPGAPKAIVIDGHHRTLASEKVTVPEGSDVGEPGEPLGGVWAWVAHVAHHVGPWDELHSSQFTTESGSVYAAGPVKAAHDADESASKELAAFRKWAAKGNRARPFEAAVLTPALVKALAPELLGDPRLVLKRGEVFPDPKAPTAGAGPAGTGTSSS